MGQGEGSVVDFVVIFRIFVPVSSSLFFFHLFVSPLLFAVLCFWRGGR